MTSTAKLGKYEVAKSKLGSLSVPERLLILASKHPASVPTNDNYERPSDKWDLDSALSTLNRSFPSLTELIHGKDVLDYGCGDGFQAVALARAGARSVQGVDIDENRLVHARRLAASDRNVTFSDKISGQFDVAISLNSMEHFPDPLANLEELRNSLRPGGRILLSFGPPWYAPYGHHMYFFCKLPWINLFFSERTVMRVRSLYRNDGATSYEPGMNRMSVNRFEALVRAAGLKIEHHRYSCVKGYQALGRPPVLRELFINQVDAVLQRH